MSHPLQLAEFVASVPTLLGFHPVNSLVLAAFHAEPDGADRLLSLARIDLPTEGEAAACVEACLPALAHTDGLEVVAVVWEAMTDASEVMDRLPAVLTAHHVPVLVRLSVSNGRLRFFGCSAGCCRVGAALPAVPKSVALLSLSLIHI